MSLGHLRVVPDGFRHDFCDCGSEFEFDVVGWFASKDSPSVPEIVSGRLKPASRRRFKTSHFES
jgi:hypothetical protein